MNQKNYSKDNFSNIKIDVNAVIKKHIIVLCTSIFLIIALFILLKLINVRNIIAIQYLVIIQIVMFILQSIPSIKDLLNKNKDKLSFNGKIISKKGFFIKTLTIKDTDGKKVKLLTDISSFQLDDKIKGLCTKHAKVIESYKKS
jgi:hypothetical protein